MRLRTAVLPALLATAGIASGARLSAAEPSWRDATRDVYVDGELDRSAQVLVGGASHRTALVSPRMDDAYILDRETGSLFAVARRAFRLAPDRASAELDESLVARAAGRFRSVDSVAATFAAGGHVVLIARHQGISGEIDEARLWETVPVWKSLSDAYAPDAAVVVALKRIDRPAALTLVFGTWCGDSKEHIPHLLKTLHAAANPKLSVRLVALDLEFRRPADVIQGRRIINVPTVLVDGPAGEIGRYTETPAGDTVEADVLAILNGSPRPHPGRYERGPEIARGTYVYRDGSVERGRESWELYSGKDGERLLHSRIESGELETEVFQGITAEGRLRFAEITRRQGEGVMRARFSIDGDTLTGSLRGREAGILKQDLIVPASFAFASPAVAAAGWIGDGSGAPAPDGAADIVCYVAPETFASPLGSTCVVTYRVAGEEPVVVPAGEFRARHVARQTGTEASDWWIHPRLGIPVRGQILGGMEYVLASLHVDPS